MAKQAKDYGLLIAAIVAIVAIVGLVILFAGNKATGMPFGVDAADCNYCPYAQEGRGQGGFLWVCGGECPQGPDPFDWPGDRMLG